VGKTSLTKFEILIGKPMLHKFKIKYYSFFNFYMAFKSCYPICNLAKVWQSGTILSARLVVLDA
jgi:hypothetical protein